MISLFDTANSHDKGIKIQFKTLRRTIFYQYVGQNRDMAYLAPPPSIKTKKAIKFIENMHSREFTNGAKLLYTFLAGQIQNIHI